MTVSAGERRAPISTNSGSRRTHAARRSISGGKRGREKERLPIGGNFFNDPPHVRQKSHVEHAIDFVEHENVHVAKVKRLLLEMIEQPARSGDDNIDAARQIFAVVCRNQRRRAQPRRANR